MPSPDYINKSIPPVPTDSNRKNPSILMLPIVNGSGAITNYLPAKSIDNGDGTASLVIMNEIMFDSDIDIGDINLLNTSGVKINPATEDTLALIKTVLDNLNLKDYSTEATLAAIKTVLDNIKLDTAGISTRASESTLSTLNGKIPADPAREGGNLASILARLQSVVDANNSSATPLGSGATFTGTATDVLHVSTITVFVRADQASATNGLVVEWSSDGTNWDDNDTFTIPSNTGKFFTFGPEGRYFRVRYTNGASAQGSFRLQVILKSVPIKPSSHRVASSIIDDDDAELVKAVLTGRAADGTYQNARMTVNGSLYTARLEEGELERGTLFVSVLNRDTVGGAPVTEALFRNDGASAIRIYQADMSYPANSEWEIYLNPTVTSAGTALGKLNLRTDSANTTSANLYAAPTVSALGTLIYGFQMSSSIRNSVLPGVIILGAGHSLLLRRVSSAGGNRIHLNIAWGTNNV